MSKTERLSAMNLSCRLFDEICSLDYMFKSWDNFKRGKRKREDIQEFERFLEDNIFELHCGLKEQRYRHGPYEQFYVTDPKQRRISKANVRDRLVHQMVYSALNEIFDKKFIFDSLSCRLGKGTHKGTLRLRKMIRKVSVNGFKPCFALKMDIKRFFDSVNHNMLKVLLRERILDDKALKIIDAIIDSFHTRVGANGKVGMPLGNVTSQLFANIYLHELDLFIKDCLREKYYLRYCDDFLILSDNESHLCSLIDPISEFLRKILRLEIHPKKLTIRKLSQGIDFVGYVLFDKYTLLRNRTKKRLRNRLIEANEDFLNGKITTATLDQKLQSHLGILSHADQFNLSQSLKNAYWVRACL